MLCSLSIPMERAYQRVRTFLSSQDKMVLVIVLISVLLKLLILGTILVRLGEPGLTTVVDDGITYERIAQNLIAGNGYSEAIAAPYIADAIRVPVLPLVMTASLWLFHSLVPVSMLGIIASVIQIVLIWRIALLIGVPRRWALGATALYAFEPAGLMISVLTISESFFIAALLVAVYGALRVRGRALTMQDAVLVGLGVGVSALTRPIGLYSAVVILAWFVIMHARREFLVALIAPVVFVACVTPWFIRNERAFGVIGFSSGGVQNVYIHFGATVLAIRDNMSVGETTAQQYENAQVLSGFTWREIQYQDLRLNKALGPAAIRLMIENPVATAKAIIYTQVAFFTNDSYRFYYLNRLFDFPYAMSFNPTLALFQDPVHAIPQILAQQRHEYFLSLIGRTLETMISALGLLGVVVIAARRETRAAGILFCLLILYFAAASATGGYGVTVRYRLPVLGLLCIGSVVLLQAVAWYYATHAKKRTP